MELTRRSFGKLLLASAVAFATGMSAAAKSGPVRFLRAVKTRVFPGRVRPIDPSEIGKPGKWLG